ncbi:hypothetical protein N9C27_00035 [Luminiphilus sp.]|nr:hypothetical protein [Luminiphilus sp.]
MNNEMKARTSNVLIAVFWVLVVVVWAQWLAYGFGGADNYDYMKTLGLTEEVGLVIWAAITGAVVAAQYFIDGTVRFKFQRQ